MAFDRQSYNDSYKQYLIVGNPYVSLEESHGTMKFYNLDGYDQRFKIQSFPIHMPTDDIYFCIPFFDSSRNMSSRRKIMVYMNLETNNVECVILSLALTRPQWTHAQDGLFIAGGEITK